MIVLPWAVLASDNRRHIIAGRSRRIILSKAYRAQRDAAALLCKTQWKQAPIKGDVSLHIQIVPPDKRRRDLTNHLKLVCDAMTGIVYADDCQIAELRIERVTELDIGLPSTGAFISAISRSRGQTSAVSPRIAGTRN
jgi:Holliday junction resolvase RusA-like endonuclease